MNRHPRIVQRLAGLKAAFFALALAVAGVSCKSAPPPAPVAKGAAPESPSTPAGPDELEKAAARSETARKRAVDFECPAYFPSEWEAAEEGRARADALSITTDDEARSAAAYNALADAYDDLFNKTIALYAQAREDEIMDARDVLTAAGLDGVFSGYLREADETALAALDQYGARDYYTARDTAAGALGRYGVLEIAQKAWLARKEILHIGFDSFLPMWIDWADAAFIAAEDAYNSGGSDASRKYAEDALNRYNQALIEFWSAYAADMAGAAREARQNALDVKADAAVEAAFNEAEDLYIKAFSTLLSLHWKEAAALYSAAEKRFINARNAAIEAARRD